MQDTPRPYTFDRVFRLFMGGAILWGLVYLLGYLSSVLVPFAVALLAAYLMNPLVDKLQSWVKNRALAVFLALFLVILALALLMSVLIPMITGEIRHMSAVVSQLLQDSALADRAKALLPEDLWKAAKQVFALPQVQTFLEGQDLWKLGQQVLGKLLPGLVGVISGAAGLIMGLVGLLVIFLYLVLLLLDFRKVEERWQDVLPEACRETVVSFLQDFEGYMNRYFRGQALVAFIVGLLSALGFALIGLPLGVLLGLMVGVMNMVPYLQLLAVPPAAALAVIHSLETGQSVWTMLALTGGVFAVVQVIQDGILTPRIMGKVTGLSPAIILLSLSVWGKLLGFFGLIIAIPCTCLVWAYYQRFVAKTGPEAEVPQPADG